MRAFSTKTSFAGNWDEDLNTTISVLDTLSSMYDVEMDEKLKAVPVLLSGDSLSYYATNAKDCNSYNDYIDMLKKWYNSNDNRDLKLGKP